MNMNLDGIRLITVHPALVHLTVGALPILVIAYAGAAWFRSEKWSFAGDLVLGIAALGTVATAAFGLVSYFVVDWPGGLETWRALHLGFGAATAVYLAVFAGVRWARRKAHPLAGGGAAFAAFGVMLVGGFAGWIGGEVLVYHGGMAVQAAGDGALAPALTSEKPRPSSVGDAMGELRGHWAAIQGRLAHMVVDHPDSSDFHGMQQDAQQIALVAAWLDQKAQQPGHGRSGVQQSGGAPDPHHAEMADEARELRQRALTLADAAGKQDLAVATQAAGALGAQCAHCHEALRWKKQGP